MKKYQFKPFDQVLVRDLDIDRWCAMHYSHFDEKIKKHYCGNYYWMQCIPYNEETAHLLGTTDDIKAKEEKLYHIWTTGTFNEWMTETEFKNFIETAVIHNKDITDFHVLRLKQ